MTDRYKTVLLFGGPGAGKGTQGAMLAKIPGFHHMSTGDMFRTLDKSSELGQEIVGYMSRGELVPDELTIKLWQENVHARVVVGLYKPARDVLLLDGVPRSVQQAELLAPHVDVAAIVHFTVEDKAAMFERLKQRAEQQGRIDDAKDDVVRRRWDVYEQETRPVLEHYPADLVRSVEAAKPPVEVFASVLAAVAPVQAALCANPLG